ncbi:hypothetical protein WBG79_04550 [Prosthecomicrobium sp. N25]
MGIRSDGRACRVGLGPIARRAAAGAALVVALLAGQPGARAQLQSDSDAVLSAWTKVAQQAGATVTIGRRGYDRATRTLDLADVVIAVPAAPPRPALRIEVPAVTLVGLEERRDGLVAAQRIAAPAIRMTNAAGTETATLADLEIRRMRVPSVLGGLDPARPFTSHLARLRQQLAFGLESLTTRSLQLEQKTGDGRYGQTVSVAGLSIENAGIGKLTRLRLEAPALIVVADGETHTTAAAALEATALDLGAYLAAFDDAEYAPSGSDRRWRTLLGSLTLEGVRHTAGKASLTLDKVELADLRLRQATAPFASLMDLANTDAAALQRKPDEMARLAASLLESIGFGRLSVAGLAIGGYSPATVALDEVTATNVSIGDVGEISLAGGRLAEPGGRLGFRTVALGRIELPPLAVLSRAAVAARAGEPVDRSALVPRLGSARFEAVEIAPAGAEPLSLGLVSLDAASFSGPIPGDVQLKLRKVRLPLGWVDGTGLKQLLVTLGYSVVDLDADVNFVWNEATREMKLDPLDVNMVEAGRLVFSAFLTGVGRDAFEGGAGAEALSKAAVKGIRLEYRDGSFFDRFVNAWAANAGQRSEIVKRSLIESAQNLTSAIPDQPIQRRIFEALSAFIQTPKSLTFTSQVTTPVPLSVIASLARLTPGQIPVLLKIDGEANRWVPSVPGAVR